ncbi:hypothetical protein GN956_G22197 [Arapaima gigas]
MAGGPPRRSGSPSTTHVALTSLPRHLVPHSIITAAQNMEGKWAVPGLFLTICHTWFKVRDFAAASPDFP